MLSYFPSLTIGEGGIDCERGAPCCWVYDCFCNLVYKSVNRAACDVTWRGVTALQVGDLIEVKFGAEVFGCDGKFVDIGK